MSTSTVGHFRATKSATGPVAHNEPDSNSLRTYVKSRSRRDRRWVAQPRSAFALDLADALARHPNFCPTSSSV